MKQKIQEIFNVWIADETEDYSGVLSASDVAGVIYQAAYGLRNKAEALPNAADTAFAIASGTKLFTGLAICKLIDSGKLSLESKLGDVLPYELGQINRNITIYQLLTHTSGVGDYIDEEAEDFDDMLAALYVKYPAHLWERLDYYLQMMTDLPPKFEPGARYAYSNSGYVLLGLVVEAVSGVSFQQFVQDEIIMSCGLTHTGFYRLDALPDNTALGYMEDEDTGEWRVNTKDLPVIGGSDGGMYSCAADMDTLWRALFDGKILSPAMTAAFLTPHVIIEVDEAEGTVESYGLGVYLVKEGDKTFYFIMGVDSGVGFFSGYYPATKTVVSAFSNTGYQGASLLFDELPALL